MTTPTTARISGVMDRLVAGARSARDGAFNTLDAIDRQSRAAMRDIGRTAAQLVDDERSREGASSAHERDARFDPEEWELPTATATNPPQPSRERDDQGHEDEYPETWLR